MRLDPRILAITSLIEVVYQRESVHADYADDMPASLYEGMYDSLARDCGMYLLDHGYITKDRVRTDMTMFPYPAGWDFRAYLRAISPENYRRLVRAITDLVEENNYYKERLQEVDQICLHAQCTCHRDPALEDECAHCLACNLSERLENKK